MVLTVLLFLISRPPRPSSVQVSRSTSIEKKGRAPLLRHQSTTVSSSLKRASPIVPKATVPNSTTTTPKSIPKQSLPKTETKPKTRPVISVNHNNNLIPSVAVPKQRPISVASIGSNVKR